MIRIFNIRAIGILSFLGFLLIAASFESSYVVLADRWLIQHIQASESPGLTAFMTFLSFQGSPTVVTILTVAVVLGFVAIRHKLEAAFFAICISGSGLLNLLLKEMYQRARPDLHPIAVELSYSFPSGHSMGAITFYATLTFLVWRHIPSRAGRGWLLAIASAMIVLMGCSRVYLGVHYPSDVIGAYLIGGAWVSLTVLVFRKVAASAAGREA